jgi:Fur family ferric uptake transcriptional regulator
MIARVTSGRWTQDTLAALESGGYRSGGARREVIELLGRQDCCVSAQEIFDRLRAHGRAVGIATIYRVLDLLCAKGLVQRIDLGGGVARYEPAHASGEHHHHLVCGECGKVEAFADEELERTLRKVQARTGYAVDAHDVVLRGACSDCR